jgi:hypothetical protein
LSRKGPLDPNAAKALDEMKSEIAKELGITEDITENNGNASVYDLVKTGGEIGGNMTRKLVEMGQNQLINENRGKRSKN